MDRTRFDQLSRNLVTRTDRRRVLQGVSGVVAAFLGITSLEASDAARRKRRAHKKQRRTHVEDSPQRKCKQASRPCSFDTHCCSGTCCNHRCCGPDETCNLNGECVCTPKTPAEACGTQLCGTAPDGCGSTVPCTGCQGVCQPDNTCCTTLKTCDDYPGQCGNDLDDGCGGLLSCTCDTGLTCLANGACAKQCAGPADCPGDCTCGLTSDREPGYCRASPVVCLEACASDAACPVGQFCSASCDPTACLALCEGV